MNCYEWRHNVALSGISISVDCSYQEPNPSDPETPIQVTVSGTQNWPDVGPPYSRRAMRCAAYTGFWARRRNSSGLDRFFIDTNIQPTVFSPLQVFIDEFEAPNAAVFAISSSVDFQLFISGFFKPTNTEDPLYICADGVWRKSTGYTQTLLRLESPDVSATGVIERIEPGAAITFFRTDDPETQIGTGTLNYTLT